MIWSSECNFLSISASNWNCSLDREPKYRRHIGQQSNRADMPCTPYKALDGLRTQNFHHPSHLSAERWAYDTSLIRYFKIVKIVSNCQSWIKKKYLLDFVTFTTESIVRHGTGTRIESMLKLVKRKSEHSIGVGESILNRISVMQIQVDVQNSSKFTTNFGFRVTFSWPFCRRSANLVGNRMWWMHDNVRIFILKLVILIDELDRFGRLLLPDSTVVSTIFQRTFNSQHFFCVQFTIQTLQLVVWQLKKVQNCDHDVVHVTETGCFALSTVMPSTEPIDHVIWFQLNNCCDM